MDKIVHQRLGLLGVYKEIFQNGNCVPPACLLPSIKNAEIIKQLGFPNTQINPMDEAILLLHDKYKDITPEDPKRFIIVAIHVPIKGDEQTLEYWQTLRSKTYLEIQQRLIKKGCEIHRIFLFNKPEHLIHLYLNAYLVFYEQLKLGINCYYSFADFFPGHKLTDSLIITTEERDVNIFDYLFVKSYDSEIPYMSKFSVLREHGFHNFPQNQRQWLESIFYSKKKDQMELPFSSNFKDKIIKILSSDDQQGPEIRKCTFQDDGFSKWKDQQKINIEHLYSSHRVPLSLINLLEYKKDEHPLGHALYEKAEEYIRNANDFIIAVDTSSLKNYLELHGTDPLYRNWIRASISRLDDLDSKNHKHFSRTYIIPDDQSIEFLRALLGDYYIYKNSSIPTLKKMDEIELVSAYEEYLQLESYLNLDLEGTFEGIDVGVAITTSIDQFFPDTDGEPGEKIKTAIEEFIEKYPQTTIRNMATLESLIMDYSNYSDKYFSEKYIFESKKLNYLSDTEVDTYRTSFSEYLDKFKTVKGFMLKDFLATENMIYDYINITAKLTQPIAPGVLIAREEEPDVYNKFIDLFRFNEFVLQQYLCTNLRDVCSYKHYAGIPMLNVILGEEINAVTYQCLKDTISKKLKMKLKQNRDRRHNCIIVHISDIHFGNYMPSAVPLDLFLDFLKEFYEYNNRRIDFLLISGDLTSMGLPTEYEAFRNWIASVKRHVNNIIVVPGNHDNRWLNVGGIGKPYLDELATFKKELSNLSGIITPFTERGSFMGRIKIFNQTELSPGEGLSLIYEEETRLAFILLCTPVNLSSLDDEYLAFLNAEKKAYDTNNKTFFIGDKGDNISFRQKYEKWYMRTEYTDGIIQLFDKFQEEKGKDFFFFIILHHPIFTYWEHYGNRKKVGWPVVDGIERLTSHFESKKVNYRYVHGHLHEWIPKDNHPAGLHDKVLSVASLCGRPIGGGGFNKIELTLKDGKSKIDIKKYTFTGGKKWLSEHPYYENE